MESCINNGSRPIAAGVRAIGSLHSVPVSSILLPQPPGTPCGDRPEKSVNRKDGREEKLGFIRNCIILEQGNLAEKGKPERWTEKSANPDADTQKQGQANVPSRHNIQLVQGHVKLTSWIKGSSHSKTFPEILCESHDGTWMMSRASENSQCVLNLSPIKDGNKEPPLNLLQPLPLTLNTYTNTYIFVTGETFHRDGSSGYQ
ncbi:hypothetical protein AAY473_031711 [Plecturocebus cupreus]